MISTKGKRKIIVGEKIYFWWIKKDCNGCPKINILSEDKSVFIKSGFDRELCIGPGYIRELIEKECDGKRSERT